MKKKIIMTALVLTTMLSLALAANVVFAGTRNRNGANGIQGTGKYNFLDGCRPNVQSGSFMTYMNISQEELDAINAFLKANLIGDPNIPRSYWEIDEVEWLGGPCCPSNEYDAASIYPLFNQCCNPPDTPPLGQPGVPGNHCDCFELRGYPIPLAADLLGP